MQVRRWPAHPTYAAGGWPPKAAVFRGYVVDREKWEDIVIQGIGLYRADRRPNLTPHFLEMEAPGPTGLDHLPDRARGGIEGESSGGQEQPV